MAENVVMKLRWVLPVQKISIGKNGKNSQTFSQNGIKNVLQILLSVRKKNNAKLIKITVRYKMQTCDFILNDKFFYGIIEGKICKK